MSANKDGLKNAVSPSGDTAFLTVNDRKIGPGEPVFVIAEASINHNGSVKRAKKLIDAAVDAGADAVKFQKRDLAEVYQKKILDNPNSAEQKYQYMIPLLKEFELPDEAFIELEEYATKKGIMFLVNGWDKKSIEWIEKNLSMPLHKVGSPDMTNDELLEQIIATGKPMIVSTGMSKEPEIKHTIDLLKKKEASFALMHSNNTYPAPFDEVNLKYIDKLRQHGVPVGYSGHERGIAVSIAAVARGAQILERHLTVDRSLEGPDHKASLMPDEFKKLVEGVTQVQKAVGDGKKKLTRIELMNREMLGKSIVTKVFIADGEKVTREMLTTRSPAKGLSPQRMNDVVGIIAQRDMAEGEMFTEDDLAGDKILDTFNGADIAWKWGPVVRLQEDFARYFKYGPKSFEFHLSDKDLDEDVPKGQFSQEVVVHAPEYMHRIYLNPAAEDKEERKLAIKTLQRSIEVAKRLGESFVGTPKLVIHPCGVTLEPAQDPQKLLARFADTLSQLKDDGVEVLPENMPPRPWVFGGEWVGNIFLLEDEIIKFLEDTGYKMCFDISHAALACNAAGFTEVGELNDRMVSMTKKLLPYIRHLHVSDASGIGDEGMQVGEGNVDFTEVMKVLAGYKYTMIPEIWQGHLHNGKGFLQAMEHLKKDIK
jgi:sialic acid synthase SpsE/sugar phosphate isomerase/epimerase